MSIPRSCSGSHSWCTMNRSEIVRENCGKQGVPQPCGPEVEKVWRQKKCKEVVGCTSVLGHSSFIEHDESRVSILKAFGFCDLLSLSHLGRMCQLSRGKQMTSIRQWLGRGRRAQQSIRALLIKKGTKRRRLGFHGFSQRPRTHSGSWPLEIGACHEVPIPSSTPNCQ